MGNLLELKEMGTLDGHTDRVWSVSWNPVTGASSNTPLIVASSSGDKTVRIWEYNPSSNSLSCKEHTQDVKMVKWHPTVDVLFSCSYDNTIKVWAEEVRMIGTVIRLSVQLKSGHASTVWAISFNLAADRMVTCSDDLTVKIWESEATLHSVNGFVPCRHLCTLSGYHGRTVFPVHW